MARKPKNANIEIRQTARVFDEQAFVDIRYSAGIPLPYSSHTLTLGCFYPYSKHTQIVWVEYGYSMRRAREERRKL